VSGPFKATADDVRALADFLAESSALSRRTGVWFCAYGNTDISLPGGATVSANVQGDGAAREYIIDDRVGD
jgi:hypothetical protein